MEKQNTIAKEVSLEGIGIHTGNKVHLKFKPAPVNSGINFIRTDLASPCRIRAEIGSLFESPQLSRRSTLGNDQAQVQTIEHLMAALSSLKIDNLDIEVDNNELPGMDGSASKFVEAVEKAGILQQDQERYVYAVKEPLFVEDGVSSITVLPSKDFKVSYTLNYEHPLLSAQFLELNVDTDSFKSEIAPARTFCLESEVSELQSRGLGRGANYDNTLVVGNSGVIKSVLRFKDEFVRHKILDLIGDLYLAGCPIRGHVIALRSGHALNLKIAEKIHEQKLKTQAAGSSGVLDSNAIMKIIPHREPFLFVDRVIYLEKGKRAIGVKNVTINDYFFRGHFPGRPVMPGVIIVEAMAQVGGVMMLASEDNKGKLAFFLSIDNVKFRKPVVPGDQLMLEVEAVKVKSKTGQVRGRALVDGKVVAEADFVCALVDN
ncbi:MAG: bifunctional UDP-3-O-[3-hydroxymyristoyl] N-acetylglucosamine deacetylase/3-hydroxyacyl-ACP dehydratase [Candidatus Omnitrophota bacterium]|jgi:UDP-3-O-[3-hydroxymyristoyl] N-acetylglucosamine deacetylase/3-hydroxyacyl-[acyl-carrier-protein] dehydratase